MTILRRNEQPWTPEQEKYLMAQIESGYTYSQIAAALQRPRNSIAGKVRRLRGAKDKPRIRPAKSRQAAAKMHVTNGVRQNQVADLMADGFEFSDIAQELGITINAVKQAFRKICRNLGEQAR